MVHQLSLLATFCFILFLSGANSQPVPGEGQWSASLAFKTNSSTGVRYASIRQGILEEEWKNLATSFTIEFWIKLNAFPTNPDGKWNDTYALLGETRFLPVVARHPGNGHTNQWSHFLLQLLRTTQGVVVVVWSGCGCAVPPQIQNGRQVGLSNCGFGYLLNSDNPKIVANGGKLFYLKPETWTHIAFSFDGDNTDPSRSRIASLYINGNFLISNQWADPSNLGSNFNQSTCQDKPMQWFREFGLMPFITLGYLNNQDFNTGRVVNNLDSDFNIYGLPGSLDEVRIWRGVRTASQISENFDIALSAKEMDSDETLVAYYNFNSGPKGVTPSFPNLVTPDGPVGRVTTNDPKFGSGFNLWQSSRTVDGTALIINSKIWAAATLPTTPRQVVNQFKLSGYSPVGNPPSSIAPVLSAGFTQFNFTINGFSPSLRQAIFDKQIQLGLASGGSVALGTQLQPNDLLTIVVYCNDGTCSNLAGTDAVAFPFRSFYLSYQATGASDSALAFFSVYPDCDGAYDACGICNGDNRTCQCVVYHDFRNVRMSFVLLTFMVDFLIDKVTNTAQILDETLDKVTTRINNNTMVPSASLQTEQLMTFYNGCLTSYCQSVTRFLNILTSLPQ